MNSLKCPKSKSLSHCLTELFPIYQNKHWITAGPMSIMLDGPTPPNVLRPVGQFPGKSARWCRSFRHILSTHHPPHIILKIVGFLLWQMRINFGYRHYESSFPIQKGEKGLLHYLNSISSSNQPSSMPTFALKHAYTPEVSSFWDTHLIHLLQGRE